MKAEIFGLPAKEIVNLVSSNHQRPQDGSFAIVPLYPFTDEVPEMIRLCQRCQLRFPKDLRVIEMYKMHSLSQQSGKQGTILLDCIMLSHSGALFGLHRSLRGSKHRTAPKAVSPSRY